MESNLADILSGDDLCNYFDFVGNFDDRDLFLFVKSAEHLCTLTYHCRLPTDTATHNVTYTSATKLLAKQGEPCPLGVFCCLVWCTLLFTEARRQGFSPGTPVSSPPSSV